MGAMNEMSRIFRRVPLAAVIMLSACAAAYPSGAADTAGAAYGPFLAARYADAQNDPAIATQYYSAALRADPGNPALLDEGFIAAVLAGSAAAPALARQMTGNAVAVMLLGNQAALQGDYAAAAAQYSQLPKDELSTLLKPLLLAWAQAGAGNTGAALEGLVPLANGSPFGGVYIISAALIADNGNDMKDAAQLYAAADGADNAPNLRLAQILASWKARQGDLDGAKAELLQMAASHPALSIALPALEKNIAAPVINTPTDGLAEAYLSIAGSLDQPAQTLLRITFLRFALTLRPDLAAARLLLASIQSGDGLPVGATISNNQLRQAMATLQAIPASDPLYGPTALQEAELMASLGETKQAVALLETLAAANPQNIDALQEAGDILRGNGQFADAIPYYNRAIAVLPATPPPAAWTLYYDRGIALDQSGHWAAAEPDMQKALAISPNQPYVLNYLGYTWALQGKNLAKAQSMLQQAAGLAPNEGAIVDSLGFVSLRQGQTGQALKLLTQAVEMSPDDAEVNAHLGDAFYAAGLHLQADYQWQRALALKPDPKLQAEIAAKLKQLQPPA
jgi:tetratricopeptide (TPR) repeat protein